MKPLSTSDKRALRHRLLRAQLIVSNAETALKRGLSPGERRDLLKDNTSWSSQDIAFIVNNLRAK